MKQLKQLEILYEDASILVCCKPAGIAVQTARIAEPDLVSQLKNYRVSKNEPPYVAVISRLDQPLEGLLVFAKTRKAAAGLSRQMQEQSFCKEYLAVVCGSPVSDHDKLEDLLLRDGRKNVSKVVPPGTSGAKNAVLFYDVLARSRTKQEALLRIRLQTGRHHQIRVQMSHAGMPLAGDLKYGGDRSGRSLALCAVNLSFCHPITGKTMEFTTVPRGSAFEEYIDVIRGLPVID